MTNKPHIWEQIDDYLNEVMSAKDRIAFESKIAQDPKLAEKVEDVRMTSEAVHFASLYELRTAVGTDIRKIDYKPINGFKKYAILVISLVVLGGLALLLFRNPNEPKLADATNASSAVKNGLKKTSVAENKTVEQESFVRNDQPSKNLTKSPPQPATPSTSAENNALAPENNAGPLLDTVGGKIIPQPQNTKDSSQASMTKTHPVPEPGTDSPSPEICDKKFTVSTSPSCKTSATGTITITAPSGMDYESFIDGVKMIAQKNQYRNLTEGTYSVTINYGKTCIYNQRVEVSTTWCPLNKSFSFNPEYGEKWEILYADGDEGTFKILTDRGVQIYEGEFGKGDGSWDGTDVNGQIMPIGNYIARMYYPDGRTELVYLTIVR